MNITRLLASMDHRGTMNRLTYTILVGGMFMLACFFIVSSNRYPTCQFQNHVDSPSLQLQRGVLSSTP